MARDCDIVHLAYEFNVYNITPQGIRNLNRPVVMTYYNINPNFNNHDLCEACDRVVLLEKTKDTDPKFTHIPMAIPTGRVAQNEPENIVGTIGFPFPWKRIDVIAQAAREAGMGFIGILPAHQWMAIDQCQAVQNDIWRKVPNAEIYTDWLPVDEVFKHLS